MRCRPGDLAVIVRSKAGNEGKIVRVLKFVGEIPGWEGDDRWLTDTPITCNFGNSSFTVRDSNLRPLRGSGGTDEMLIIAGTPETVGT